MKPDKIILLRHGQSQGNCDKLIYRTVPDYALMLSELGRKQAETVGQHLRGQLEFHTSVQFYVSPYWRARQTFELVRTQLTGFPSQVYEDPRIREQEWSGDFRELTSIEQYNEIEARRDTYGHFYYRLLGGESCADVFDRVSDFMNTLHRDFDKRDFPRNVIIVTHGMTMRLFLMRWFHMKVEDFELLANPLNCEYYVLERNKSDDHYALITKPRTHEIKHKWQYRSPDRKPEAATV